MYGWTPDLSPLLLACGLSLSVAVQSACFRVSFDDAQISCATTDQCPPGYRCHADGLCRAAVEADGPQAGADAGADATATSLPDAGGGGLCRSVSMSASVTYDPTDVSTGSASVSPPLHFALPARVGVSEGLAGDHWLRLTVQDELVGQTSCCYQGNVYSGGTDDAGAPLPRGDYYLFHRCLLGPADCAQLGQGTPAGFGAGDLRSAGGFTLWLFGDSASGRTAATVTLRDVACDP